MNAARHDLRHLRTDDGVSIAYALRGDGAGRPRVALVHSLAMDHAFWDPVAERLAPEAAVLAIDARGHGASGKPAGPYTAARMAQDLLQVMDAEGWPSAVVAGASMGGCVALQFAADHPQRTDGLGLFDTTAWYGPTAPADWQARAARATAEGLGALVDFQRTRWFSDAFRAARPGCVDGCVQTFLRNDPATFAATCAMLGAFDGRALLPALRLPTAVLVGEEDYAAPPAMARALHEGIAGSTLEVIPAARHLTPLETPDTVADALRALIARTAPRKD